MDYLEKQQRKIHPKDKNGVISNIFFLYAIRLFKKGFKSELEERDLYEVVNNYKSSDLGDKLEQEWQKQKASKSVVRLLLKCYGKYYLLLGFMQLLMNICEILIPPYAMEKLVAYFSPEQKKLTLNDAYFYAGILLGFNFLLTVYRHNYYFLLATLAVKVRAAFCSFLYRKSLKLSPVHVREISIGKIVTLVTKDVEIFDSFIDFTNNIWIGFVKTVIVAVSLYMKIGISSLTAIGYLLLVMPIQMYLGYLVTPMKMKMCKRTDDRLSHTQETLSAIRIIKMYAWEKYFTDKIYKIRRKEMNAIFKVSALRFLILSIGGLNSHIAFYLMIICYVWLGNAITSEKLYFIIATFQNVTYGLSILFPLGVYQTAELKSAIKRMGHVFKTTELKPEFPTRQSSHPQITLIGVTLYIQNKLLLENININLEKGLTIIVGPVGSGKSLLLQTILQNYNIEGVLKVEGSVSYASQEPWLFPSSIRQNILFGQKFDETRYNEVLKVCALTYDFEILEAGDGTIVEDRGINLSKGQQTRINLARAIYKESDIYLLDDSLAALDSQVSSYIFEKCILTFLKDKVVVLVNQNAKCQPKADTIVVLKNGQIEKIKKVPRLDQNHFKTKYIDIRETTEYKEIKLRSKTYSRKVYYEEKKPGEVSKETYKKYIRFGGGFAALTCIVVIYIIGQVCMSFTDKLVSNWVNLEDRITKSTNTTTSSTLKEERLFILYMYTSMTIAMPLTSFGKAVAVLLFTRLASIRLHKQMLSSIINASMKFFDCNFIGNILNRFSKDLVTIDEQISLAVSHVFRIFLVFVGVICLVASVNAIFLIPTAIFIATLILVRKYCLRTTRSLKRLDALTKSPVIGHLNATLEGLTTISAFGAQNILQNEFDRHQDLHTSALYTLQSSITAFSFTLEIFCGLFVSVIVLYFLTFGRNALAGDVGLALSQAFLLTETLQWGIRQWAEIENRMTSVERVLEYSEINQEPKQGTILEKWPKEGNIEFKNVSLTYNNSSEKILKNLNFIIKPNEKVGIIGRTGAGKSSIASTLFRLYDIEGKILIDDVDIKTLSLHFFRKNISIIPQDPILFTGTIRDNVDPIQKVSDKEVVAGLQKAHLEDLTQNLNTEITDGGSCFSIGQKQLICLARTIIQKNKIIILDEATANIDSETEELIYKTIEENFKNCTVLTITHKLQSVLKNDRVMVIDRGEIVAFDNPQNLLANKKNVFYQMVKDANLLE